MMLRSVSVAPVARECEFLPYCIRNDVRLFFDSLNVQTRDIDVSCFHDPQSRTVIGTKMRGEIAHGVDTGLPARFKRYVGHVGQVGRVSRNSVNDSYIKTMARSRIVVTCQPDSWEGDYRTFEALTCGPLVLCDRMIRPPEGFEDGENIVFYDGPEDMLTKLKFYLTHEDERYRVARNGFVHARAYHQANHRMEYACLPVGVY